MLLELAKKVHSILGVAILFILLLIVLYFIVRYLMGSTFSKADRLASLLGLFFMYMHLAFGLMMYYLSSSFSKSYFKHYIENGKLRIFILEQPVGIIMATVFINWAYLSGERKKLSESQVYIRVLLLYVIGYCFVLYSIPWLDLF